MEPILAFCIIMDLLMIPLTYIEWTRKCYNECMMFAFSGCCLTIMAMLPELCRQETVVWDIPLIAKCVYASVFAIIAIVAAGKSTPSKRFEHDVIDRTMKDCLSIAKPYMHQNKRTIWKLRKNWAYSMTMRSRNDVLNYDRHLEVVKSEADRKQLLEERDQSQKLLDKWCKCFNKINSYEKKIREDYTLTPTVGD